MNYFDILLAKKLNGGGGGDITVESLSVTSNGTYSEEGKAYTPVTVEVQPPANSYQLKSITTPTSLATFEASAMPMPSLKASIKAQQDLHGYDKPWVGGAGYNKWNEEWELGQYSTTDGTKISNVNSIRSSDYISVTSGATYYFCIPASIRVFLYDNTKTFISSEVVSEGSYTIGSDVYYITFHIGGITTYANNIAINYPASETTYTPYSNICPISGWDNAIVTNTDDVDNPTVTQTTTISLGQTVYGGEVDVVNGTSGNRLTNGFVDLGTLTYTKYTVDANKTMFRALINGIKGQDDSSIPANILCSNYKTVSANARANGTIYIQQTVLGIDIIDNSFVDSTADDFKTAMSGVQLVYELATPTTLTTQPTPIKSLNGQNNLSVDCGEIIEGEYFKAL